MLSISPNTYTVSSLFCCYAGYICTAPRTMLMNGNCGKDHAFADAKKLCLEFAKATLHQT